MASESCINAKGLWCRAGYCPSNLFGLGEPSGAGVDVDCIDASCANVFCADDAGVEIAGLTLKLAL